MISSTLLCVKKEVEDPVLELFELGEIDDTGHFVGSEHPLHRCFDKFDRVVPRDPPPDIISRELLDFLPVLLRVGVRVLLGVPPRDGIDFN